MHLIKEHNPAWTKTTTILTDKDFTEQSVYSKAFPSANLHAVMSVSCFEVHEARN